MHTSKDNAYVDNNNIIRFASITTTQGLEWNFNVGKFNIIGENLPIISQNIVLMLCITPSVANVIANDFKVNNELADAAPNHKIAFIDM
jgi:hypothetical protein